MSDGIPSGRTIAGAAVSQRPLSVLGKELSRVKNSERYQALWLDSLLPVIEAGQLETVDGDPAAGRRTDRLYSHPGHSRTMPR